MYDSIPYISSCCRLLFFFFQAEDGIRDYKVTGVQTCALPISLRSLTLFEPPLFAAGEELAPVLGEYRALLDAGDLGTATRLFAEKVARVPEIGRASCRERV